MKTRAQGITAGRRADADRAVLLAHGAGSDLEAPALAAVARELARRSIPSLRFNFAYRDAGRRPPDRAPVLDAAVRAAADQLSRRTGLAPERLVLGGRSMGGRICSMAVSAPAEIESGAEPPLAGLGLLLLGYPLHPAGRPDRLRTGHFPGIDVPCLFVSGTRDALAGRDELTRETRAIAGAVDFRWLDTADHGFRPLRSSGSTPEAVLERAAEASADWVESLPSAGRKKRP